MSRGDEECPATFVVVQMETAEAAARDAEKAKLKKNTIQSGRRGRRGGSKGEQRPGGSSSSSYSRQEYKKRKGEAIRMGKDRDYYRTRNIYKRNNDGGKVTHRMLPTRHQGGQYYSERT